MQAEPFEIATSSLSAIITASESRPGKERFTMQRNSFDLRSGQTHPQRGSGIRRWRAEGDNGLLGKKLDIDHYGPGVPIGGGAPSGKDPHKVDKCGVLRARQLAKKLVRGGVDEARVTWVGHRMVMRLSSSRRPPLREA